MKDGIKFIFNCHIYLYDAFWHVYFTALSRDMILKTKYLLYSRATGKGIEDHECLANHITLLHIGTIQ